MKQLINKENRIDVLWDKYIFECKLKGYVSDTLENKEEYFSLFYRFMVENNVSKTEELTQDFLDSFVKARLKSNIKEVSVNSGSTALNAFFHWLYKQSYLSHNIKFPKLITQEAVKQVYSTEELKILLEKPSNNSFADFRTWVIINYILGTGNRISSVLSITNDDVNLIDGFITLPHTKSKRVQTVPLSSSLIFILKNYMDIRQGEPTDKLFCTEHGESLTRGGADKALRRYCEERNINCLGHHALRHTFAKISVRDCNIDSFRLQRLMGHSDIRTTEHYVHLFSDDLKQNIDNFNPLEHILRSNQKPQKIRVGKGGKR